MDILTTDDLRSLVGRSGKPCASIYLPTHRAGTETLQDPIRFKNLLREAEKRLLLSGCSDDESAALLRRSRELLDDYKFWQHQDDGLAVFIAPDFFRLYRVQFHLPELAVVGERFHVKPLLAGIANDSHFYVLSLSQHQPRLFRGTQASLVPVDVDGMPASMSDALQHEITPRQIQGHSAGSGHGGHLTSVLHGVTEQDQKESLVAYFRRIDQALHPQFLKDPGPLVLACVNHYYPLYQKVNGNPTLLDAWITGSPDGVAMHELHRQALAIANAHFGKVQKEACDQYLNLWHTQRASNKLSDVLPAATHGRVASLLVAVGVQTWGHMDAATNEAVISQTPGDGDEDLLNLAAIHTYITGGKVYAVEPDQVPGGGNVAAVFRY